MMTFVFLIRHRQKLEIEILYGQNHVSNCALQRMLQGDLSPQTLEEAKNEEVEMKAQQAGAERQLAELEEAKRTHARVLISGLGGISCDAGDGPFAYRIWRFLKTM